MTREIDGNRKGKFRMLELDSLLIPAEDEIGCLLTKKQCFQRNQVNKTAPQHIAQDWDWVLCGALIVIEIKDSYYVVDGGHRLRAARIRGDIDRLPCMVYPQMEIKETAKAFVDMNCKRRNLSAVDKHKANLIAGDRLAEDVERIITNNGYQTCCKNGGNWSFDSVAALYTLTKIDPIVANQAFAVCSEICKGERIYKELLLGIFELELRSQRQRNRTALNSGNVDKLISMGTAHLRAKVNSKKVLAGSFGGTDGRRIAGMAVLEEINKGRRSGRLRVDFS